MQHLGEEPTGFKKDQWCHNRARPWREKEHPGDGLAGLQRFLRYQTQEAQL
jgi:hypothetical protein